MKDQRSEEDRWFEDFTVKKPHFYSSKGDACTTVSHTGEAVMSSHFS